MNSVKWLMSVVIGILIANSAHAAEEWGIELGARQQGGEALGANISANSQIGFQGGVYMHMPLEGTAPLHFRSGLFYTQRPLQSEADLTGETIDFHLDYLDIPLEILIKGSEKFGFYMGVITSINISKSCSGDASCSVKDVQTPIFPMIFGAVYKFTPKFGLDFYVDGASAAVARGLVDYKSVGLNLMYSMD